MSHMVAFILVLLCGHCKVGTKESLFVWLCVFLCVCPLPTLPIHCHVHLIVSVHVFLSVFDHVCVCLCNNPCGRICVCVSVCMLVCVCVCPYACVQIHSTTAMQFPSLTSLYPSIIDQCPHVSFYMHLCICV